MSHNATKGRSRCFKTFVTNEFAQKPDYSGFDTSMWLKRSIKNHQEQSKKHGLANTKGEQTNRRKVWFTVLQSARDSLFQCNSFCSD